MQLGYSLLLRIQYLQDYLTTEILGCNVKISFNSNRKQQRLTIFAIDSRISKERNDPKAESHYKFKI
jgi:hypothetical protein